MEVERLAADGALGGDGASGGLLEPAFDGMLRVGLSFSSAGAGIGPASSPGWERVSVELFDDPFVATLGVPVEANGEELPEALGAVAGGNGNVSAGGRFGKLMDGAGMPGGFTGGGVAIVEAGDAAGGTAGLAG